MLFGHNTNLTLDGVTYHVQTEDRGEAHAILDTAVYCRGRVMHHRTTSYRDLLPFDEDRLRALKLRLDDQHRSVIEEIRSGALQCSPPASSVESAETAGAAHLPPAGAAPSAQAEAQSLKLEFRNPKTWLKGNQATLLIAVRDSAGKPVPAGVRLRVEGAATPTQADATTGPHGDALFEFAVPRSESGDLTFIVEAVSGSARGQLRFQLKAKPRPPLRD
jgi:hypothetical protein